MAIAFFSTWTTYGSWLPGDQRGWFHDGMLRSEDELREIRAALSLIENAVRLNPLQRRKVEDTIVRHCEIRHWTLHAANCRTNHVHVVCSAPGRMVHEPREPFKAWCIRELNKLSIKNQSRENWWSERGWDEYVDGIESLENVVKYVRDLQD